MIQNLAQELIDPNNVGASAKKRDDTTKWQMQIKRSRILGGKYVNNK